MTNIYVGNLPYATEEQDLIDFFSQYGEVSRATIVFDRDTGRSRGFGFVEMEDPEMAKQAIEASHGAEFKGRPLTVNEARPRGSGRGNYQRGPGSGNTAKPAESTSDAAGFQPAAARSSQPATADGYSRGYSNSHR